ncbi:sensor histidine kinase [Flavobacterium pallidum]|uniref:histidine kinase n=1 Tax=Flavobacterium pallidum TaxID=2172098 RepID=A0A2S1SFI1_9FLAO|nr:sensor histidine kinase [Flavobacterium pallidum]AWI25168.1 hypothetical protein HYN49_04245 [Flavobacterium pallidum]
MRNPFFRLLFLLLSQSILGQQSGQYDNCRTSECRILESYKMSKYYLESDDIALAQKWLNKTKNFYPANKIDTLACSIHNLQSELFYYMGLFQFGADEADSGIEKARQLNDSVLTADAYFFRGINQFELHKFDLAQQSLQQSLRYFPKVSRNKRISNSIEKEHIYNNLAQVKLKISQQDSALVYNHRAYELAKINHSKRGIPNAEQTFGEIYLSKNQIGNSKMFFEKSVFSALKSEYYDIALVDYGFLTAMSSDSRQTFEYYKKGTDLIQRKNINAFFRRYFYELSLKAFTKSGATAKVIEVQENIIRIDTESKLNANTHIQDISEQYVNNEKKLLTAEIEKFRRQKKITFLLIITASLCIAVMTLAIVIIRKRNKAEKRQEIIRLEALLDGQEKERKRIAEDLHDGLNGDLSAIKHHISSISEEIPENSGRVKLQKIIEMVDQVCSQTRSISHDLMPASIMDFGLVEALKQYCVKINTSHPIVIDFQYFGAMASLPKNLETTIYRIIQELINNAVKHSGAAQALVQMNFHEREIFITVEDNGKGFDLNMVPLGLGLKNIRSRVHLLHAEMEINSTENGSSFQIIIDLTKLVK